MRLSNYRHPGSERGLRRVCPPIRYVSSGARVRRVPRSYILFHIFCRQFLALAPKSGAFIGRKLVPGPPKNPYRYARFSVFSARGMWPTDSPFKKRKILFGKRRAQCDILLFGKRTCGNSALCRSYITFGVWEQIIVKIFLFENIIFGVKT